MPPLRGMTVVRAIGCFPLRRPEIWMLSLAVLLLLVMASVSYTDWRLYRRADRHALQIRDALTALEQFLDTMLDAETGQRGFLLTEDAPYLEPYDQALQVAPHHLTQLTQALAALQDAEVEGTPLRLLADQKLAELRETLDVYRTQGLPAALEVVRSTRGKRLMDDLRRRCAHLHQGLTTALYAERAQVDAHAQRTHLVAVGGALLLFGFLLVASVTIHRAMQGQERALAEARATRDLLETTLASIGDAVLATDAGGRIVFTNPTAQALLRWPAAEMLGRPLGDVFRIINEDTRAPVESPIVRVLREGIVVGLANHTTLMARDGAEIPIDDSGAPIRDPAGTIQGTVVVFRDITARRQAEAARAHLGAIVESSEDAILSTTLDGIITSWNRGAERLYGSPAAEMIGQSLTCLVPPDLPDDLPQLLVRLRRGEALDHYETQRMAKDGTRLDIALTLSPLRNDAGQLTGVSTIARDITARKQAEAELERRRQETALLAALAQGLSASLDLDTVLQRVVSSAQALCRSERAFLSLRDPATQALVGRYEIGALRVGYAGLRLPPGQGMGAQVLRTGQPWRTTDYMADPRFSHVAVTGVRAGGHLAMVAVPIAMGGQVAGVLYVSNPTTQPFSDRDEAVLMRLATHAALAIQNAQLYQQAQAELTERTRAEAALAQAAAELEQRVAERTAALHEEMAARQRLEREAQRVQHFALLGRLAAGVSHEIRNPLGAVFLHVDLLAEELGEHAPESAALVADTLADIRTQLTRLDDLVQDYLSLVRAAQIERTPEDLGVVLRGWVMEWQALAAAHGGTCQCDGLDGLGVVAVHAATLRRAVLNLVQNALDAMPHGGTLTLRGQRTATAVRLQVQDTGSGMDAATLAQIFEPLYTTKPGGTGLGLYIVQEIVAAHGGQVTVESVVGQGTLFTLTVPLEGQESAPA